MLNTYLSKEKQKKTMNGKFDISERERKTVKRRDSTRTGHVLTSHNIKTEHELTKWYKMCNAKRGGKSRHIT